MRVSRKIHGSLVALALAAIALPLFAQPAGAAGVDFGLRAGAYLEDHDPFVGLELLVPMGSTDWYFNPNAEFVFADERDRASLNFDFHYDFQKTGSYYVWAGAGLAAIHKDGDRRHDSETDAGVNLLAGVGWRVPNVTPYVQLKAVFSDDSELVAAVGVRF